MKQFKLLILLLVIGFVGEAQINYLPIKSRYKLIAGLFDSTLHIPSGTTPSLRTGGYSGSGAIFYKTSDSTVYVYTGTQWISVKGSGGGGSADSTVFATLYRVDTAKVAIRLSIAGKLNISDTAALVAGYTRLQRFTDSLAAHTARFDGVTSSLATKLNISDTANMRPRLYAGSNVTITGTYPNLTIASSGGGSSDTSTFIVDTTYNRLAYAISADSLWLKSIKIQLNGSDITPTTTDSTLNWDILAGSGGSQSLQEVTDIGSTTTNKIDISDTLQSDVIVNSGNVTLGDSAASLKYAIFYGTSITAGQGVTSAQRWSALTAAMYGMREYNRGISGTKMVDASGSDSSMFNRIYTIPVYSSSYGALFFEYGTNDATSTDTTTFKTKYAVVLDSAIARGWPVNKITVVGPSYSIKSTIPNVAIHAIAAQNISATKGVNYVELYNYMSARGGNSLLQSDSVHISVQGNIVINNAISHAALSYNKTAYVDIKGSINVNDSAYIKGSVGIGITNTNRAKVEIEGSIVENYTGGTTGIYQRYLTGTDFDFGVEFQGAGRIVNFLNKANGQGATTSAFTWQTGTTTSPTVMLTMARNGNLTSTGSLVQTQGDFISNYTGTTKFIGSKYLTGSSYQWGLEIGEGAGGSTGTFKIINRNTGSTATAAAFQFQTSTTGTVADIVTMLRNGKVGIGITSPDSILSTTSLMVTGGVRLSGLPTAKRLKQVYWNTDGSLSVGDTAVISISTEGSYTPTLTNTTNVAASTAYTTYYARVGDWVHVWGTVDIDATAATTITEMDMTLPIATTLSNVYALSGTASFEDNTSVQIKANTSNGKAMWRFTPQSATNNTYSFHFSYKYTAP